MDEMQRIELDAKIENAVYELIEKRMQGATFEEVNPIYLDSLIQLYIAIQMKYLRRTINAISNRF